MASANALALGDVRLKLTRPICGTLRSQAVFYALSFFQLDGFAKVHATGRVLCPEWVIPFGDGGANR
jgi:hypothetical protein